MLARTALVVLATGILAVGCGTSRPAPRLFALADVYEHNGDFEAAALLRVDAQTLQPLERRGLRLRDAVTSQALGPDGKTIALGGYNDGEILFVDLAHPRRVGRIVVARPQHDIPFLLDVVAWPRASRLVAVATLNGVWWGPHPSTLLVVDPQHRRVTQRLPLHGTAYDETIADGNAVVLVVNGRAATVVVVTPDGRMWRRPLRLNLGGTDGVRVDGTHYAPTREPALSDDHLGHVFVVAPDRRLAEIRVQSRTLVYHDVPIPRRYISNPPPMEPGSGGVHLRFVAGATWLGRHELAVTGFDELPRHIRGSGTGHTEAQRTLAVVDTRTWRLERTLDATTCRPLGGVVLCSETVGGFPPDGKGYRGASLVAYDRSWHVLYRKQAPDVWWDIVAGRLVAGAADGTRISLLEPRTGRVIRTIKPSPLHNQMWPLELFTWRPPH